MVVPSSSLACLLANCLVADGSVLLHSKGHLWAASLDWQSLNALFLEISSLAGAGLLSCLGEDDCFVCEVFSLLSSGKTGVCVPV